MYGVNSGNPKPAHPRWKITAPKVEAGTSGISVNEIVTDALEAHNGADGEREKKHSEGG
jgi:hypothetical protein